MGHRAAAAAAAAAALDKNNNASHQPGHEAGAPDTDMVPQPKFSAPIPGPQPGFAHGSEFNLHQIHYDDLYAPGPAPAKNDQEYDAPDPLKPQPAFSAPIPGPQPGFAHDSESNLHQIQYDDLYAPGPAPAKNDQEDDAPDPLKPQPAFSAPIPGPQPVPVEHTHYDDLYALNPAEAKYDNPQGYDAPHPLKSQPTFSAPVAGPQPGFFQESSNINYQPAQPAQQITYHHQQRYDAPDPLKPLQEFSAPVLGPQPGFFLDQHGHYPPNNGGGHSTDGYAPVGPHVVPFDPAPIQPLPIPDYQNPIQPPQVQVPSYNVPWTTGLFDCFDDPTSSIVTLCVPCVTFGQAAEIIDQGSTTCATHSMFYSCVWFLTGCPCILSCSYRTKLRAKYNLMESPANDCLTHFVCELCALCQMHRELVNRGIDPSIGWQGNIQRMQQRQQKDHMAPPPRQAMM